MLVRVTRVASLARGVSLELLFSALCTTDVLLFFTAPSWWPPACLLHKLEPPSTLKNLSIYRAFHHYVVSRLLAIYPQPSYLIPHWPNFYSLLFIHFLALGNCLGPILYRQGRLDSTHDEYLDEHERLMGLVEH